MNPPISSYPQDIQNNYLEITRKDQQIEILNKDEEIRQKIFYEKHKILRLLRKIFKWLSPHRGFSEAMKEATDAINDATGVNIELADSIAEMSDQTTEGLKKACEKLENISLVLTETSKQIENKGLDITQIKGDRKEETAIRDLIINTAEKVQKDIQRDISGVANNKPNMSLCKNKDGDIYLASISDGSVKNIYKLNVEQNKGYSFSPSDAFIPADELTELCKMTDGKGNLFKTAEFDATKAIMVEKQAQLAKAADAITEEVTNEKSYFAYYDPDSKKYNIRNKELGQTLVFDFSKPNEITADLWSNNNKNSPSEKLESNVVVMRNAENGIAHNILKKDVKDIVLTSLKIPEVASAFKQIGVDNVAEIFKPKRDKSLSRDEIMNSFDNYIKSTGAPKPIYIDEQTFPDINLRRALQETLGTDMVANPMEITKLELPSKGIRDLTGLDKFENLSYLDISKNRLNEVNLTLPKLATLAAANNHITHVALNTPLVANVDLSQNEIVRFDSHLPVLANLNLSYNMLRDVDYSAIPTVQVLDFTNNELKNINDISRLGQLEQLKCGSNLIEGEVNIQSERLEYIRLDDNRITSLVVNSDVPVKMIQADHNPISEAYISETNMKDFPPSCDVMPIAEAPKEKLHPKEAVYVAVTSVSSNGEIEATTFHDDGTPAIGADKAAAVNANNTRISDTDFTRGEGVSKSAALEGSDSVETKMVVTEQREMRQYNDNSREEYRRDVKEDNQRFKEEKEASKNGDER